MLSVGVCFNGAFAGTTGAASTFNSGLGVLIETKHSSRCYDMHFGLPARQLPRLCGSSNGKYTPATGSLSPQEIRRT